MVDLQREILREPNLRSLCCSCQKQGWNIAPKNCEFCVPCSLARSVLPPMLIDPPQWGEIITQTLSQIKRDLGPRIKLCSYRQAV
ncbi:hypothetical protein TNCT_650631 [Trichonephila clavata]|uniref:Uncharacterized protein n=1 Tax=Trichonephila clavata TaxID=2740835 RepID=A0A8X6G3V3_TRICU|nr:hypothetical protein TNCT_650631 [Trichonephila clavata]